MIQKIRNFIFDFFFVRIFCRYNNFCTFFSDLFQNLINTFVESHDLKGKIVIPFATSGGGKLAGSAAALKRSYPALNWKEGRLLNHADEKSICTWIDKLGYHEKNLD